MRMYKPFVIRKLVEMGAAAHPLEARKLMAGKGKVVTDALEKVVHERPVLLKRDPVLHRHSIQGFRPKLVSGKAIKIRFRDGLQNSGASGSSDSCPFQRRRAKRRPRRPPKTN